MMAVAIKKRQLREKVPTDFKEISLRCDGCGEEFSILHDPIFMDKTVAGSSSLARKYSLQSRDAAKDLHLILERSVGPAVGFPLQVICDSGRVGVSAH